MPRLKSDLLDRVEAFSHRTVDVAEDIEKQERSRRIVDQMMGAGSAVGANAWEAAEALSVKDFCKCLGISLKELSESRYWIRFVIKRGWVKPPRVADLLREGEELQKILGAIIHRSRRKPSN